MTTALYGLVLRLWPVTLYRTAIFFVFSGSVSEICGDRPINEEERQSNAFTSG